MVLNIEGLEGEDELSAEEDNSVGMLKKTGRAVTTVTDGLKREIMKKTTSTLTNLVNKRLGTSEDQWSQVG